MVRKQEISFVAQNAIINTKIREDTQKEMFAKSSLTKSYAKNAVKNYLLFRDTINIAALNARENMKKRYIYQNGLQEKLMAQH